MKKEKISTGSINFRITASGTVGVLVFFVLIDMTFLLTSQWEDWFSFLKNGISGEAFLQIIRPVIASTQWQIIFAVELVLLILKIIFGSKSVRHKLAPMERVSRMAMELGAHDGPFDEEKLRRLENAIDNISPAQEDASLNTGDKELVGLELAVNGLIRRMRESYQQQARFVSDASHELRTPIAVIKGYADMLDRWGKSDEKVLEESVEAIKTESNHMSYLIEQLLFLARGDSGKTQLKITEFDLFDMMREVFEESSMIDPKHEYIFEGEGPIPVQGDLSLIKQTARILIDNASKYTHEGDAIRLKVAKSGPEASFSVQDSGIGIASEDLPHLFERFYRADDSRARETGGTGLGLAIAKWIVDRHNGRFSILSREEIGTKITVTLPQSRKGSNE